MPVSGVRQRAAAAAQSMRSFNLLRFLKLSLIYLLIAGALLYGAWQWAWYFATQSPTHDQLAVAAARPVLSFANTSEGTPQGPAPAAATDGNGFGQPDAPIASYAEYRRCGGAAQTVRAHGDLMSCSVPRYTDRLRLVVGEGETFYRQMRAACNRHDFCYAQGGTTYGLDQASCDKGFLADVLRECTLIYSDPNDDPEPSSSGGQPRMSAFAASRARQLVRAHDNCRRQASLAYAALRIWGYDYHEKNYQPICDYEPGPHAARDAVVAGHFLDPATDSAPKDYVATVSLTRDQSAVTLRLLQMNASGISEEVGSWSMRPEMVPVIDKDIACRALAASTGGDAPHCPETLKDTAITAADWVRFNPIVADADGQDGAELILLSLTRDFGLGFTHIRFTRSGGAVTPDIRGYLGVARFSDEASSPQGCEENLEFSDCAAVASAGGSKANLPILSNERSVQSVSHDFLVVDRRQRGCGAPAYLGQDILLNSRHALRDTTASGNMGFRLRRFTYDKAADRWIMHRDRHQNDGHRVYRCGERVSPFEHYKRFQYPQFNAGFDVECDDANSCPAKCSSPARGEERLEMIGAMVREKCPTSTFRPGAGELNDVDFVLYDMNTDISGQHVRKGDPRDSQLDWVDAMWSPFIWKEPAHPLATSAEARKGPDRIMAVGTYVGGDGAQELLEERPRGSANADRSTDRNERLRATLRRTQARWGRNRLEDRRYPVLTVLRHRAMFHKTLKGHITGEREIGEVRIPDTHGHLPDRYAVYWSIADYGNPASYYELPSVLFSLGTDAGTAQRALTPQGKTPPADATTARMAMAFFLNPHLSAKQQTERQRGPKGEAQVTDWEPGPFQLQNNMFRALIVPVPNEGDTPNISARMIDCPVEGALIGGNAAPKRWKWDEHFFKNEPVLVGHFFSRPETGGRHESLAVAWRRQDGAIQLTGLQFDGQDWRFGDQVCRDPVPFEGGDRKPPDLRLRKLP